MSSRSADPRTPGGEAEEVARIGVLGKGTVGGAFAEQLAERAFQVEAISRPPAGDQPACCSRSEGDFEQILARLGRSSSS